MPVDLDGVALGLVEDVDHLVVAEKHLPRPEWCTRVGGVTYHHGADEGVACLHKRSGLLSGRGEKEAGEGQPG